VKKGTCKDGDSVNIDYVGKIDGEKVDNACAEDQTITLGSSGYIDGFDDSVIGMKVGETKDANLTFPDDYGVDELNGKDVVFTITLNYISETETPELTDKLVKKKTDYSTVEEYKQATLESLKKDKKDDAGETAYSEVEDNTEVTTYPDSLVQTCSDQLDAYYQYLSTQYGFTDFTTFLTQMGMDEDSYKESLQQAAQSIAKTQLIAEAIAEKEGITVSDDEIAQEIASAAEESSQEESEIRSTFESLYGDTITIEEYYRITLLTNKVIEFVGENAVITE
jgi:trigger factor